METKTPQMNRSLRLRNLPMWMNLRKKLPDGWHTNIGENEYHDLHIFGIGYVVLSDTIRSESVGKKGIMSV